MENGGGKDNLREALSSTIIEWGPPVKYDLLDRTRVLLYSIESFGQYN